MYESRPLGSPPAYSPSNFTQPFPHRASMGSYEYDMQSPPPGSYYIEEKPQHFYKWSSPPGIIRILEGIVIILCLAIFACVASTLQWQYGYGYGMGGMMGGMGGGYYPGMGGGYYPGMGGSGYYPGMGGYGYGGHTDPRAATGFMIAMAAISFIAVLAFFIASVSKSQNSRTRKFYLLLLIFSAILGGLELIASIVYIMGVNPTAGSGGSLYYTQMRMLCAQFYSTGAGMMLTNEYLYHYCIVDPQEAVAIVCGFLAALTFCIIAFFAQRVRQKIWKYGKPNILWEKNFADEEVGPNVEEWVKTVPEGGHDEMDTVQYFDKPANGVNVINTNEYNSQPITYSVENHNQYLSSSYPSRNFNSTPSENIVKKPPAGRRKKWRRRGRSEMEESQYETDYTTGAESGDDMDDEEWDSLYPPITSDPIRQEYKRQFDTDHREYKQLCAEMDEVNNQINFLSKRLDVLTEDDPSYEGVAEEYNRLKDYKKTSEYQTKRLQSRHLKRKLSHIKRMVNEYDRQRE
ncbi:occludin [Rhincodon typus]|uniref:occludin n=1 Tax=Rhincodon typus TaxID=259920 RepID=UPI0009A33626|nr:occludin [Rhincodon typus]